MLYRFQIELSDIDRGVYESLDLRLAQHPSETPPYLLTRVLAYAFSYQPGLEFSGEGLANPDQPAIWKLSGHGTADIWIEIGNPSARKLHKATKTARDVFVFTYKSADVLLADMREQQVHRAADVQIYSFKADFLEALGGALQKTNRWSVLIQDGQFDVSTPQAQFCSQIGRHPFAP
jgi:uncharacterized protein YaeQ